MNSQQNREYSDSKAEEIDAEVYRLVKGGHDRAVQLLRDNIDTLHRISEALIAVETVDGNEIEMIVKGGTLQDILRERTIRETESAKEQAAGKLKDKAEDERRSAAGEPVGNTGPVTA